MVLFYKPMGRYWQRHKWYRVSSLAIYCVQVGTTSRFVTSANGVCINSASHKLSAACLLNSYLMVSQLQRWNGNLLDYPGQTSNLFWWMCENHSNIDPSAIEISTSTPDYHPHQLLKNNHNGRPKIQNPPAAFSDFFLLFLELAQAAWADGGWFFRPSWRFYVRILSFDVLWRFACLHSCGKINERSQQW